MKKSKLATAKSLAKAHFRVEPYLKRVHLIRPPDDEDPNDPIKLLEVVEGTLERGLEPVTFAADPARGIYYPSIIVEISPTEYEALLKGKLDLGVFPRREGEKLRKKRSVTLSPKKRRDLASKAAIEQEKTKNLNGWTLGEELLSY